ncbi:MAG: hypothetical protein AAGK14_00150 [Verrucomicrobiota bacterium]
MKKIFLFEDDDSERAQISNALKKVFRRKATIIEFPANQSVETTGTLESRVASNIAQDRVDIGMIICDQDLSSYIEYQGLSGLSAEVVTTVAREYGIPIAIYGRGESDLIADKIRQKRGFLDRRFFLELGIRGDMQKFAKSSLGFFEGCRRISDYIEKKLFSNEHSECVYSNPAAILADILGRPEIETRLRLYSSGDQQYLESLLFINSKDDPQMASKAISCEISYWLWESILRFPGLLLNEIAASSFLNIDVNQFNKEKVRALFKKALYKGPFGEIRNYWWRDDLEELLVKNDCEDGYALAKKSGLRGLRTCRCSVDGSEKAGYYCMLTDSPVGYKNSVGKIPYFPAGADLSRISKSSFYKIAPWAGIEI